MERYRIVDEDDIERALTATQEYISREATEKRQPKVMAIAEAHA